MACPRGGDRGVEEERTSAVPVRGAALDRGGRAPVITVALLRGVNVGGRRPVRMADLVRWLEAAGFEQVQTYIQSGNVIVAHDSRVDVARTVQATIAEHAGFDVPVVTRSAAEMADVLTANPFRDVDPAHLHVAFLAAAPDAAALAAATRTSWDPEEFVAQGRDVYLHLPRGMGRSVMVPRLALVASATTRNWNTVLELTTRARARMQ